MTPTDKEAERRRMATAIAAGFAASETETWFHGPFDAAKKAVEWATVLQAELDRTASKPPTECAHLRRHIAGDHRLPAKVLITCLDCGAEV